MADKEEPHEIGACYSLHPAWRKHVPSLYCSCGARGYGENWEEAGSEFDLNHEKTKDKE